MLEPYEQSKEEKPNIQMDRDVLSALLKAWLVPRSTGKLAKSEEDDVNKENQSSNSQPLDDFRV